MIGHAPKRRYEAVQRTKNTPVIGCTMGKTQGAPKLEKNSKALNSKALVWSV